MNYLPLGDEIHLGHFPQLHLLAGNATLFLFILKCLGSLLYDVSNDLVNREALAVEAHGRALIRLSIDSLITSASIKTNNC